MQSNPDIDHEARERFLDGERQSGDINIARLKERAIAAVEANASQITGGYPDEPVLGKWEHENLTITRLPSDEQGILRMSVGGGCAGIDYCVFRGNPAACLDLLERTVTAIKECVSK